VLADCTRYLDPDPALLLDDVNATTNPKFHALNRAVVSLVSRRDRGHLTLPLTFHPICVHLQSVKDWAEHTADTHQIEDQNLVSFLPLDVTSEDSVNTVLSHIDNMMQYGEDEEPKVSPASVSST
jgi:hypothetical protein